MIRLSTQAPIGLTGQAVRGTTVRAGAAALDYILAIGIVFPLLVAILPIGRRAMQLVYQMTTTLIAWPFM